MVQESKAGTKSPRTDSVRHMPSLLAALHKPSKPISFTACWSNMLRSMNWVIITLPVGWNCPLQCSSITLLFPAWTQLGIYFLSVTWAKVRKSSKQHLSAVTAMSVVLFQAPVFLLQLPDVQQQFVVHFSVVRKRWLDLSLKHNNGMVRLFCSIHAEVIFKLKWNKENREDAFWVPQKKKEKTTPPPPPQKCWCKSTKNGAADGVKGRKEKKEGRKKSLLELLVHKEMKKKMSKPYYPFSQLMWNRPTNPTAYFAVLHPPTPPPKRGHSTGPKQQLQN